MYYQAFLCITKHCQVLPSIYSAILDQSRSNVVKSCCILNASNAIGANIVRLYLPISLAIRELTPNFEKLPKLTKYIENIEMNVEKNQNSNQSKLSNNQMQKPITYSDGQKI